MTMFQERVYCLNHNEERCQVKQKQNEISVCLRCGGNKCVCEPQKSEHSRATQQRD
jgi:hypothetical protein